MGYRFRLHRKSLPGCPDIVFPKCKKAIFVHGCFWHGHKSCKRATIPKTRTEYWLNKISKTIDRDAKNLEAITDLGWQALVVWQCEVKKFDELEKHLKYFLDGTS